MNVHFGEVGAPPPDWRDNEALQSEVDPDDEQLDETPEDVMAVLGFDPVELFGADEDDDSQTQMSEARAPRGGITIGGKRFKGGQFVPASFVNRATPAQRKRLSGTMQTKRAKKRARQREKQQKRSAPKPAPLVEVVRPPDVPKNVFQRVQGVVKKALRLANLFPTFAGEVVRQAGGTENAAKIAIVAATILDTAIPMVPVGSALITALASVKAPLASVAAAKSLYAQMRG